MIGLKVFIFFICSMGYLRLISRQPGIGPYKAPFLYCCFISLGLFLFAIAGQLKTGLILTTVLGCSLLAYELWMTPWRRITGSLFPQSNCTYLIFAPFIIYYVAIQSDFKFILWDEFSFWLSSTKFIFETDALFTEHSPIYVKSYPPLQQLFQYYFTTFFSWSEKHVLYAQTFWVLSALLCALGSIVKSPLHLSVSFLLSSTFLYFFGYSFSTIYSDPLLGACFAACIALAYSQRNRLSTSIAFFISIFAFVLIKEIAVLLAAIAMTIFGISVWANSSTDHRGLLARCRYIGFTLALGLLGTVLILRSWAWYVAKIKAARDTVLPPLADFMSGPLHDRLLATLTEFTHRIAKPGYILFTENRFVSGPSIIILCSALTLVGAFLIWIEDRPQRLKTGLTLLTIFGGSVAYTLALFASYLIVFTEYEGIRLASFERYLSSCVLAWVLITYGLCVVKLERLKLTHAITIQAVLSLSLLSFVPRIYLTDLYKIESVGPVFNLRQDIETFAANVKRQMKKDDKVYFIAQNSNGLERVIFYYSMLPYTSSMSWCWSLGSKYFEGDVWTCNVKLNSLLVGYDYLAIYRGDYKLTESADHLLDRVPANLTHAILKVHREAGVITALEQLK